MSAVSYLQDRVELTIDPADREDRVELNIDPANREGYS